MMGACCTSSSSSPASLATPGSAIRMSATTGSALHLVEPLGFDLSEAKLRRAGPGLPRPRRTSRCTPTSPPRRPRSRDARVFAFTTQATTRYTDIDYVDGDVLLFGPEPTGLPPEVLDDPWVTEQLPHPDAARSPVDEPLERRRHRHPRGVAAARVPGRRLTPEDARRGRDSTASPRRVRPDRLAHERSDDRVPEHRVDLTRHGHPVAVDRSRSSHGVRSADQPREQLVHVVGDPMPRQRAPPRRTARCAGHHPAAAQRARRGSNATRRARPATTVPPTCSTVRRRPPRAWRNGSRGHWVRRSSYGRRGTHRRAHRAPLRRESAGPGRARVAASAAAASGSGARASSAMPGSRCSQTRSSSRCISAHALVMATTASCSAGRRSTARTRRRRGRRRGASARTGSRSPGPSRSSGSSPLEIWRGGRLRHPRRGHQLLARPIALPAGRAGRTSRCPRSSRDIP